MAGDDAEDDEQRVRALLSLLAGNVPYVVLAVVSAVVFSHVLEAPARLLAGLESYLLPTSEDIASAAWSSARADAPPAPGARRRGRQQQRHGRELERVQLRGLRTVELSRAAVPVLSYFRELDHALTLAFVSAVALASGWALPRLLGLRGNAMVEPVALACVCYGCYAIFSTTWASGAPGGAPGGAGAGARGLGCSVQTPEAERVLSGCFGVLAGLAALVFLAVIDRSVLDFDVRGALRDTQARLARSLARPVDFGEHTGRAYAVGLLALAAAALGSSLFSAAVRTSRCFALAVMAPPEWGAPRLRAGAGAAALMKLDVLLPACAALLWVRPLAGAPASALAMAEEALGAPRGTVLPALRVAALAAAGLAGVCAARHHVRSFMGGVLVAWYESLYATSRYSDDEVKRIERAMGMKVRVSNALMGKVALQSAAPGAIMLGAACVLTVKVSARPRPGRPGAPAARARAQPPPPTIG